MHVNNLMGIQFISLHYKFRNVFVFKIPKGGMNTLLSSLTIIKSQHFPNAIDLKLSLIN